MFVFLSKIADVLLEPGVWALLLVLGALFWTRRRPRFSAAHSIAALVVLYGCSLEPVAGALMRVTEGAAESTFDPTIPYDAVILLGGGLDATATRRAGHPEFNAGPERFLRTYELLRTGSAKDVLISGGALAPSPNVAVEAVVLARQLEAWGIARERIVVEGDSRNTYENARFSAEVIKARGWKRLLLVTSAFHMRRAVGCFHAQGLEPDVLPVDFRGTPSAFSLQDLLPRAKHLAVTSDAVHELFGRAVYRVMGYSK